MARSSKPLVSLREQAQVGSIPTRLRQPKKKAVGSKQQAGKTLLASARMLLAKAWLLIRKLLQARA
jgi:hypothetical protein